jgi:hypothetical protein
MGGHNTICLLIFSPEINIPGITPAVEIPKSPNLKKKKRKKEEKERTF